MKSSLCYRKTLEVKECFQESGLLKAQMIIQMLASIAVPLNRGTLSVAQTVNPDIVGTAMTERVNEHLMTDKHMVGR